MSIEHKFFGPHRFRSTFYHIGLALWGVLGIFVMVDWFDPWLYGVICWLLVPVDYLAEMYDPHPANPGPWYEHFHRVWTDNDEDY